MGFYWLGLFVFWWERKRAWAWAFGALGLVSGFAMGVCRMAQGGHWFTDVLWSAGFVYLSAWLLYYVLNHGRVRSVQRTRSEPEPIEAMDTTSAVSMRMKSYADAAE
jgi:membrane-associated PAP2 superfamily phosphatase